jgi:hypothetical protein
LQQILFFHLYSCAHNINSIVIKNTLVYKGYTRM